MFSQITKIYTPERVTHFHLPIELLEYQVAQLFICIYTKCAIVGNNVLCSPHSNSWSDQGWDFLPSLLGKKPINILYDITIRERQSANAS